MTYLCSVEMFSVFIQESSNFYSKECMMSTNRISGYLWITFGLFCLIFFGGKLFFQLIGVIAGFSLILKGMKILAIDGAMYNYSMHYFNNQFRK